jgi:hypothetical protein
MSLNLLNTPAGGASDFVWRCDDRIQPRPGQRVRPLGMQIPAEMHPEAGK